MYRTHTCGQLRIGNKGEQVTLAGWVQKARKLGGMTFIDLRDRYGVTQLVVEADAPAGLVETATSLGREFVIQAVGEVVERQAKNAKMDTGDIEIKVSSITVLNKSVTPPFTIEDESDGGDSDEYIMLALRLTEGLVFKQYQDRFGQTVSDKMISAAKKLEQQGLCIVNESAISLTVKGFLVSNNIISDLI